MHTQVHFFSLVFKSIANVEEVHAKQQLVPNSLIKWCDKCNTLAYNFYVACLFACLRMRSSLLGHLKIDGLIKTKQ